MIKRKDSSHVLIGSGGNCILRIARDSKGLSNVVVAMLSLIIVVTIVANVVLWSYQMNQFDLERMHEDLKIVDVSQVNASSINFTFVNDGSYTAHLVDLWINNSTSHQRYDISVFIDAGDTAIYTQADISVPEKPYTIKIVTERGNTAIYPVS